MNYFAGSLRPFEMNEDVVSFKKSYSLDPFPVPDCQVKKRITDKFRKRKEPIKTIDCNGGIASKTQRSDHEPLLVNTPKRWHSLELNTVRGDSAEDAEHDENSSGCEELIDSKNKSLGRSILKSWLVGIFQGKESKSSAPNGSGGLLHQQQQQSPANAITTKSDRESIV
jgi:hypothetical protein